MLLATIAIPTLAEEWPANPARESSPSSRITYVHRHPGDVVVGDAENEALGDPDNFNFPDAIDLDSMFSDDAIASRSLEFSYYVSDTYTVNGALPLTSPSPERALAPSPEQRLDLVDLDLGNPGQDGTAFTLTFRNVALSPPGGPNVDPGGGDPVGAWTRAMTLFASDGTTVGFESFVVYTSDDTSDSLSAGGGRLLRDDAFPAALDGWFGARLAGSSLTTTTLAGLDLEGLCARTGLAGANAAGWAFFGGAYGGYVELVDDRVWRIRSHMTTDRIDGTSNQPILDLVLHNTTQFYDGVTYQFIEGLTYAGQYLTLDNEGGANAIGKPQGRDHVDHCFAPAAARLPQWRGFVDPENGAFAPGVDDTNDFCPMYRVIDTDPNILASVRDGSYCVERVQVFSESISARLAGARLEYGTPISSTTHFAVDVNGGGGSIRIDDAQGFVDMQMTAHVGGRSGSFHRVGVYDQALAGSGSVGELNAALYPVSYTADTLYLISSRIESLAAAGQDALPGMPVDILNLVAFQPSLDCLGSTISTHGSINNMQSAASPRNPASVGDAPQDYLLFFYTNNLSLTSRPNGAAFAPWLQFFTNNHAFPGPGSDPFRIRSLEVHDLGTDRPGL